MATKKTTTSKKNTTVKKKDLQEKVKNTTKKTNTVKKTSTTQNTTKNIAAKKSTTTNNVTNNKIPIKKTEKKSNTIKKEKTEDKLPISKEKKDKKTNIIAKNNNLKIKNKKFITKIKIILLSICKVVLIFTKNIKKFVINKYNSIRHRSMSKNKEKKKVVKSNNEPLDELTLLKYKDYQGFAKITVFFINRIRVIKFDMKRFKKKFKYGTLKDKLLIILMLLLIAGFSCVIAFCVYIVANAPEISQERLYKSSSTVLLTVKGEEFGRLGVENREKVTYDELPQVLVDAIVATEDSRFFQHNGIDIARFTKAVIGQLLGQSDAGGGSTLTMQVSKNAATNTNSSGIRGIIRKFTDIYLAVFVFEKQYTKEQIIEFYVNIPFLGAHSYGVEQASKAYFGKSVSELTLVEAATIAGLFQAPAAYDPYAYPEKAENRRNTVLNLMYRHGYITEEERDAAKSVPMKSLLIGKNSSTNEYQDFIDTVVAEVQNRTGIDPTTTSMVIYTTMDPEKQKVVNGVMTGETYKWKNDNAQAGIAVISVEDGSLVAVGASRDPGALVQNYAYGVKNQPGSTAKPILDYGPAIEYLNWSTGATVIDEKMTYSGGASIKNFDNRFLGVMTAKEALAQSRNIPALYTFQQTTSEQKATFAANVGWDPEVFSDGNIYESDSIGGFKYGVTPVQSAAAYATFARGGTYIEPYSFTKIEYPETGETYEITPKKRQAMSEETAYMINMILKYAVTSGQIGTGAVKGTDIASKTGTSTVSSARKKAAGIKVPIIGDSWQVAYSPDYAISTWYGYPQLTKTTYLTSTEGGTARKTITKTLVQGIIEKNARFKKPSGVVTAEIEIGTDPLELASPYTPKELRSTEYFKKGTVPNTVSTRFSQLSNASDLKYTATDTTVTLNWTAAKIPDAINTEYLREYFSKNVYKKWTDKYLQERIDYNNKTFGTFGYEVYMTNANGTVDLGFTTNTVFTANVQFDSTTSFTVKTSYQLFKSNQSTGISVSVQPNTSTTEPEENKTTTTTQKTSFSIEYIGKSCSTVEDYNALGSSPSDKIKVVSNGKDVTKDANITATCYNTSNEEISCNNLQSGGEYNILFTIRYNNSTRNKSITLKPSC